MKHILLFFVIACASQAADLRVLVEMPDGSVNVITPAWKTQRPGETEADFLTRIRLKARPDAVRWKTVDFSSLPSDRYFRNAWRMNVAGDAVRIPRAGAEAVHLQKLRTIAARKREAWSRRWAASQAEGRVAEASEAQEKLQALRSAEATDLTTPSTLNELKQCVPSVLKEPDP